VARIVLPPPGGSSSSSAVNIAGLPAGSVVAVRKVDGVWPARPTARADIVVHWVGADPDPVIVASGTGGALDNVDVRIVAP